jgi:GDP-mannose 6-dehydrogenase
MTTNVTVIGAGYVGCVSAACLAKLGHDVTVVDTDPFKVKRIHQGRSAVVEPGLEGLVAAMVRTGKLKAALPQDADLSTTQIAIVCVSTPSLRAGGVDTRSMQRVFASLSASSLSRKDPLVVAVRSTISPQRLAHVVGEVDLSKMRIVVNPEFLRETTAIQDFEKPPFILIGGDDAASVDLVASLYRGIEAPVRKLDLATALLVKYACNAYHGVKIAFANEMASIAEAVGADPLTLMSTFCDDKILNVSTAYLRPGFAFGGSCLPKDIRALVAIGKDMKEPMPLLRGVLESNENRLEKAANAIVESGAKRLSMLGISFKRGTDDLRESPYLLLAKDLVERGIELKVFDPDVHPESLVGVNRQYASELVPDLPKILTTSLEEALEGAEGIIYNKRLLDKAALERAASTYRYLFDLEYLAKAEGVRLPSEAHAAVLR